MLRNLGEIRNMSLQFQGNVNVISSSHLYLLPTGSEKKEVFGGGGYSCCNTSLMSI